MTNSSTVGGLTPPTLRPCWSVFYKVMLYDSLHCLDSKGVWTRTNEYFNKFCFITFVWRPKLCQKYVWVLTLNSPKLYGLYMGALNVWKPHRENFVAFSISETERSFHSAHLWLFPGYWRYFHFFVFTVGPIKTCAVWILYHRLEFRAITFPEKKKKFYLLL